MATLSNSSLENGFSETDLDHEDVKPSFFYGLKQRRASKRAGPLEQIARVLDECCEHRDKDESAQKLLRAHLPTILRLSLDSPFADVTEASKKLVAKLKENGVKIPRAIHEGSSLFMKQCNQSFVSTLQQFPADSCALFEEAFLSQSRVSHIVQVFGHHPKYLDVFLRTHNFLMRGDGPLPYTFRHYIAILAASRHCCSYLVSLQEAEFLEQKGDPQWLEGLQHIPRKLYKLLTINKLLAHQPWRIKAEVFEDLLIGPDSFSLAELAHAIVIMTHYHSLASFALGSGVNPEIDTPLGHVWDMDNSTATVVGYQGNPALGLVETSDSEFTDSECTSSALSSPSYRKYSDGLIPPHISNSTVSNGSMESSSLMSMLEMRSSMNFEVEVLTKESRDREFQASLRGCGFDNINNVPMVLPQNLFKYLDDPDFTHEDIESKNALSDTECSWEDHACPLIDQLYSDMGTLLDERFQVAFSLTYNKVGGQSNVETELFRQAVCRYIQAIKGIRYDDYNYKNVNTLLHKEFKKFIRLVACLPEKVTQYDFNSIEFLKLEFTEKIHINFLVSEARFQAELLYAFRALMQRMKHK